MHKLLGKMMRYFKRVTETDAYIVAYWKKKLEECLAGTGHLRDLGSRQEVHGQPHHYSVGNLLIEEPKEPYFFDHPERRLRFGNDYEVLYDLACFVGRVE